MEVYILDLNMSDTSSLAEMEFLVQAFVDATKEHDCEPLGVLPDYPWLHFAYETEKERNHAGAILSDMGLPIAIVVPTTYIPEKTALRLN